jgi:hypothetical protein
MFDRVRPAADPRLLLSLLAALALILTACGSSTTTDATQGAGGDEAAVANGERSVGETGDETADAEADGSGETTDRDSEESTDEAGGDTENGGPESAPGTATGVVTDVDTVGALMLASVDEPVSHRFEGTIELTGEPGSDMPGTFSLAFTGAQDPAGNASDVTMDFSGLIDAMTQAGGEDAAEMAMFAGMLADPMRTITIGDTSYVQWSLLTMFTGGDGDMWLETTNDGVDDLTSSFGMQTFGSPEEVLAPLQDANATIVTVGNETVRGTETTHYRAEVEFKAWYEALAADERTAFDAEFDDFAPGEMQAVVPIELWITDDGRVAKLFYDISDPALMADSDGLASATITIEVYDFGADLGIVPPPADKILSEDEIGMSFGS